MNHGKTRSSLYGVVGVYLIYTAYDLFQGRSDPDTTMSPLVMLLFIVLFLACGIALIVCALKLWKKSSEEEEQQTAGDENSLKS